MMPRIIHYCWFGHRPMPRKMLRRIASWRRLHPDYNFVLWNEDNFDINVNTYVREAYEHRRYAFVSDYVRLHALSIHGGIYLDTDMDVILSLDPFLDNDSFAGFEDDGMVGTAILGCGPHARWVEDMLATYADRNFVQSDGYPDLTPNVVHFTDYLRQHGLDKGHGNETVILDNELTIYPRQWFYPKSWRTRRTHKTADTHAIHRCEGSWLDASERRWTRRAADRIHFLIDRWHLRGLREALRFKKGR